MLKLSVGLVERIIKQDNQIQLIEVKHNEGESIAIHYLNFHFPLRIGETVVINQTANYLQLGTGGYDFVVMPFTKKIDSGFRESTGHIMKLRYTPYQFSIKSCEEEVSEFHSIFKEPRMLEGLPVLIGELHSMLPIIITIIRQLEKKAKIKESNIVYIMTDGGALPIAFSKHVNQLKELGWLKHTITYGQSFGGDLEAVNIFTSLIAAKYILKADLIVVLMGPGITGTGTWLGHSGVEQGIIINAVASLEGLPVSILRASSQDKRKRQMGISHHTISSLRYISLVQSVVPYPNYIDNNFIDLKRTLTESIGVKHKLIPIEVNSNDVFELLQQYPYQITTMGRAIKEDQLFFDFAASSAYWAFNYLDRIILDIP